MNETEFIQSMMVLEVKPGDIVVLKSSAAISEAQVKRIIASVERILPEGVKVMLLDSGLDIGVMRVES